MGCGMETGSLIIGALTSVFIIGYVIVKFFDA
jgi:hypothetical protein